MQLPDYVPSLVLLYCRIIYLENLPLYVIGGSLYNNKKVLSFDFVSIFSKKQIIITHFETHKTARINTRDLIGYNLLFCLRLALKSVFGHSSKQGCLTAHLSSTVALLSAPMAYFPLKIRFLFHRTVVAAGQFLCEDLIGLCGPALEPK